MLNCKMCLKISIKEWATKCVFLLTVLFLCIKINAHSFMEINPSKKILIIDDFHPIFNDILLKNEFEITYLPNINMTEFEKIAPNYPVIACRSKVNFSEKVFQYLPNLKCIARGGAGMDNIDEKYAKEKNILLLNAPEGNRNAVAEHTLGLILNLSKKISNSFFQIKNNIWDREYNRGFEIDGKTIGIIGFGNSGSALAKKLQGFDVQILAYDKYKKIENNYIKQVQLDELKSHCDIISLHIPLTNETEFMVNENWLYHCKNNLLLINTSRGKIVKLYDVLNNIENNKLLGFGTDVLENENLENLNNEEKIIFEKLKAKENVLMTPHVAGWTIESYEKIAEILAEKIVKNI